MNLPKLLLLLASVSSGTLSQVLMNSDGHGAYEKIRGSGYDLELPDCVHPVRHITDVWDHDLRKNVFAFTLHKEIDNDRCKNFDRQRCEITSDTISSPESLRGTMGEVHWYRWKFKLDRGFQPSPNFYHIHQIKAGNGPEAGAPIITITPRHGDPEILQIIFSAPRGQAGSGPVLEVPLAPFKGEWVEALERVTFTEHGTISLVLRRVSDDSLLLSYEDSDIALWRPGATWNKPKFGIYRSLRSIDFLRDETVLFADILVSEGEVKLPPPPENVTGKLTSPGVVRLHWTPGNTATESFRVDRSLDGRTWQFLGTAAGNEKAYSDTLESTSFTNYYRVRAENAAGNSGHSAVVLLSTRESE